MSEIVSKLEKIVGAENVKTSISDIITYHATSDVPPGAFMNNKGATVTAQDLAIAVVRPCSVQEVSDIVKFANRERTALRLVSAGTAINGGIIPQRGEIILDLHRMNWIKIHQRDGYVELGPAVNIRKLNQKLERKGYHFPVYPGSERVCSVGGVIGINTSGHSVDSYSGKPANYLLGLEVVLPTGEIIETGCRTLRQWAGPDLTRFFVGSEGLFGVMTNIYYRLVRKPTEQKWALAVFPSILDCAKVAQRILQDPNLPYPVLFEVMYEFFTDQIFLKNNMLRSYGSTIMLATDGYAPGEAEWKMEKILTMIREMRPLEVRVVEDEAEWKRILYLREAFQRHFKRGTYAGAVSPPLSKLPEIYEKLQTLGEKMEETMGIDLEFGLRGHIGGPCCHPGVAIPEGIDDNTKFKLIRKMREFTQDFCLSNGCSWGEQGIFPHQAPLWYKRYGPTSYKLLKNLKKTFDPNNILNPSNLLEFEEIK